ncbi:MAG: RNB domain-containing ribonuclease, partial [Treponemataceae bacterium]
EKLTIALSGGETVKVRDKDVDLLHSGPCAKVEAIEKAAPAGDVLGAWELLEGSTVPLSELAELAFGTFTPETAWAAWLLVKDGLRFSGTPDAVSAKKASEIETEEAKRNEKARDGAEREAFLSRLASGTVKLPEDGRRLQDIEALALGKTEKSKTMKDAGKAETPVEAHKMLLSVGYWPIDFNPHPSRFGKNLISAKEIIPPPPEEERLDLRALKSYAIDNAWSADPDDAVSLDGDTLWVHVADPAASIKADDACDVEARGLGETLYLPEGSFRMLAEESLPLYALGLSSSSPALSFKIVLNDDASIKDVEIHKTLISVDRLTYGEADARAAEKELAPLFALADKLYARRLSAGAVVIELPETHLHVKDGEISIDVITSYRAADMVREFMLIAGNGAARWAIRNRLPFPFVAQELGDLPAERLPGLAGSYQLRRCMRPRRLSSVPGAHAGLGLSEYTQVTSPLRRYTDLVAHQQIRAFLDGKTPQTSDEVLARIAAGEAAAQAAVQAERASRQHWTMVLLSRQKDTLWDAVVVDRKGNRSTVLIPALAMETTIALKTEAALNDTVKVALSAVKIPELEAAFVLA